MYTCVRTNLGVVITEWPNGVVDEHQVEGDCIIRKWPDGQHEEFDGSAPQAHAYPRF